MNLEEKYNLCVIVFKKRSNIYIYIYKILRDVDHRFSKYNIQNIEKYFLKF